MSSHYLTKCFVLIVLVAVLPEFLNANPMADPGIGGALAHGAFAGAGQSLGRKAFDKIFGKKDDKITSVHVDAPKANGCYDKTEYRGSKKSVTTICPPGPQLYQPAPGAGYYPPPQAPPSNYFG